MDFANNQHMDMRSLTDCLDFTNGKCASNQACCYRHCQAAVQQLEKCADWPQSCRDLNCPYQHPAKAIQISNQHPHEKPLVVLLWNIESIPIPTGVQPFDIVQQIRQKLVFASDLKEVAFYSFCNMNQVSEENQKNLNYATVTMVHIPHKKKGAVQLQIMLELSRFERVHRPPATIILISDNIDFGSKLSYLRHQVGFNVIVVHNKPVSEELSKVVNEHYSFELFTKPLKQREPIMENISKTSENPQRWSRRRSSDRVNYDTHVNQMPSPKIRQSSPKVPLGSPYNQILDQNSSVNSTAQVSSRARSRARRNSYARYRLRSQQRQSFETQSQVPTPDGDNRIPLGAAIPIIMPRTPLCLNTSVNRTIRTSASSQQLSTAVNDNHPNETQKRQTLSCFFCTNQFNTIQALRQHQNDKKHLFCCSICKEGFPEEYSLRQHQSAKGHGVSRNIFNSNNRRSRSVNSANMKQHGSDSKISFDVHRGANGHPIHELL